VEGRDDRDVQEDGSRQDMLRGHGDEPGAGRWRVGFEGSSKCLRAFGDVWRGSARRKQSARQEEVSVKDEEVIM
jgi:hypothetical protein